MQLLMPIPQLQLQVKFLMHTAGTTPHWKQLQMGNPFSFVLTGPPLNKKSQLRKLLQKVVAITDTGVRNNFSNQRRFVYV